MSDQQKAVEIPELPYKKRIRDILRIWQRGLRSSVADRAAYRGDFIITTLVVVLFEMITPLLTVLVYSLTGGQGFPGWNMYEVLMIQAVFLVSRGIAIPFFFGLVWTVHFQVRAGTFELTLLRPRSEILICMAQNINIQGFGRLIGGIIFLVIVAGHLPAPTFGGVLLFLLLLAVSEVMMLGLAMFMSGTLFIWVGNSRLSELLDTMLLFAKYPGSIFSSGFQLVLSFVIPVGMVAIFPAQAILGREQPYLWISIVGVLGFFVLARAFWKHMMKNYTGAGG
ncbi:MAG: ABC-2 family transporter protein [Spirochaetales bacterium]|nr:ABC-2 family transporter protein [Spirochaetales bacterium]